MTSTGRGERVGWLPLWRIVVLMAAAAAVLPAPAGARDGAQPQDQLEAQSGRTLTFDIPAQPLPRALTEFGRQSGVQVAFDPAAATGKTSVALGGTMTPEEALRRLLAGSGLSYQFTSPQAVTVSGNAAGSSGVMQLEPLRIEAQTARPESGTDRFVATRSSIGTKTDTPIIEIPQTVNVVTRDEMTVQAPSNVMEALSYTPGVYSSYIGPASMGEDHYVTARGFLLNKYLDGQRVGGAITGTYAGVDPYMLESVEVLKGPSSVLFGGGTPAGVLNITSKRPTERPLREVMLQGGSWGRVQGAFDLSGPIDPDKQFLFRLTAIARDAGTQFGNNTKDQRIGLAPSVTWRPTADTDLTLFAKYQYDPNLTPFQFLPALGTVLPNPNGQISSTLYTGDPQVNNSWVSQTYVGYSLSHRFDDVWSFGQNVRYENVRSNHLFVYALGLDAADPTMQTASRYSTFRNSTFDRFAIDSRMEAKFDTGPLRHSALIGVDYQTNRMFQSGGIGAASTLNLYYALYGGANYPTETVSTYQTATQIGIYVQDQIRFGDWLLTLGGRHDSASATTVNRLTGGETFQTDAAFSGRAGLTYLSSIGLAPYVSVSTSFEPVPGTDWQGGAFKPLVGRQFEVGLKYKPTGFNGFMTLSAFDIVQQNVLTADPLHPGFSTQTGEISSKGVELDVKASLADGLDLSVAYAFVDAMVTQSNDVDLGKVPTLTPRYLASAWLDYMLPSGPLAGLMLGAGVRYVGSTYATASNVWEFGSGQFVGTPSFVPGYTLFDATIRYDLGRHAPKLEGVLLSLNARNLFDTQYIAGCTSAFSCYYGSRRTILGSLTYRW